jgi:hypothetical protein
LDQEKVPCVFPGEEEQVAPPRVVEEECESVVLFGVFGDNFGEAPYYQTQEYWIECVAN